MILMIMVLMIIILMIMISMMMISMHIYVIIKRMMGGWFHWECDDEVFPQEAYKGHPDSRSLHPASILSKYALVSRGRKVCMYIYVYVFIYMYMYPDPRDLHPGYILSK